jgi:hypothetical protein
MHESISFAIDFVSYALEGQPEVLHLAGLPGSSYLMSYTAFTQFSQGMIVTNYNDQVSWGSMRPSLSSS